MPEFLCDVELTKHLNEDPLLKHMNKRFVCAMIGKAGSGKSSLMLALLQTKKKFKEVFQKIYVWMTETSKCSIKKCAFDVLPDNQQFEGVTFDSLQDVYDHLKDNSSKKQWSLLVFDDVQAYLKNTEIQKALLHIIANSRHLRTCMGFFSKIGKGAGRFFGKIEHGASHFFTKTVPDIANKVGGGIEQGVGVVNKVANTVANGLEKVAPIASMAATALGQPEIGAMITGASNMVRTGQKMVNNANNIAQSTLQKGSGLSQLAGN
eukprot:gene18210-21198_t